MRERKRAKSEYVFLDKAGKRWKTIKLIVLYTFALCACLLAAYGFAVYGGTSNALPKNGPDTNFDVISNISRQIPDKIVVPGEGTFVNMTFDEKTKDYTLYRGGKKTSKTIALTFDDGPDPIYTRLIMNILEREQVPATFFLVGNNVLRYPEIAKEIVTRGYLIGNHTLTHLDEEMADYTNKKDRDRLDFEISFTQRLITEATGYTTDLFRAPFWGAEDQVGINTLGLVTFAMDKGYIVSTPTLDSRDWSLRDPKAIIKNSTENTGDSAVLLLHDAGGNRTATIQALPGIIKELKAQGYSFVNLSDLYGKPLMHQASWYETISSKYAAVAYNFSKHVLDYLNPLFIAGLIFSILYSTTVVILSLVSAFRQRRLKTKLKNGFQPPVTVIIPAFNEGKVISKTIQAVLNSDYPHFKVLVIDDGSTDKTFEKASGFSKYGVLRVIKKKNGGKHSALNLGVQLTKTEIFVAIDADTIVAKNTLSSIVRYFQDKKVGAVAGNVKVGNHRSILGIFQAVEYTLCLNIERNAYSFLNSILVVPGAIGAWNTQAVREVGGYSGSTMTEDAELTLRLLNQGYKVEYDKNAIAFTEAPQKPNELFRQRFRWTFGVFQTLFRHRDLVFRKSASFLGWVVLPFTIFVQIPIMLLTPLMDLLAIYYIFFVSMETVELYALVYLVTRVSIGLLGYLISGDNPWPLFSVPFSRIFYQPLLYAATYSAFFTALKGIRPEWKKAERTNSVEVDPVYYSEIHK